MANTKEITVKDLRMARLSGLGEVPVLFYGDAKENGIKTGDTVTIRYDHKYNRGVDTFEVGSYIGQDQFGRKVSGFALL